MASPIYFSVQHEDEHMPVPVELVYHVFLHVCLRDSSATFVADPSVCGHSPGKGVHFPSHYLSKATSCALYFSKHRKLLPLLKIALPDKNKYLETERLFLGF